MARAKQPGSKVLITTSGVGQRLGDITKHTNKALLRMGAKPVISHIIESYPEDTHFVITLGHFGDHIKDFVSLAYPELSVEYIKIKNYDGPGSSLGLSMLQARKALQGPFIYHASDTLVSEPIQIPKHSNWIGVSRGRDTSQYVSWTMHEGALRLHERGSVTADFVHIGLIGVKDYKVFWDKLAELIKVRGKEGVHDAHVLAEMIKLGTDVETAEFKTWLDVGNVASLREAQRHAGASFENLHKPDEAVFLFDDFVIKFFDNPEAVKNRVKRAKVLKGFVPAIQESRKNFYRYPYVPGELYPNVVQPADFKNFLSWAQEKFWGKPLTKVPEKQFREVCKVFYKDKTEARVKKFFELNGFNDNEHIINGEQMPTLREMFAKVDFDWLSHGIQSRMHGDFVLDNIIRTQDGYVLLDWRQDFGGLLDVGDRYYDLAKLNHNLTINHAMIHKGHFTIDAKGKTVTCGILRPSALVDCQAILFDFLSEQGYDAKKVEMLTALNWLNGAALHHHPYNLFLYYFGKLHLWRALQNQ